MIRLLLQWQNHGGSHCFVFLFHKCLLGTCYMPSTILEALEACKYETGRGSVSTELAFQGQVQGSQQEGCLTRKLHRLHG